MSDAPVLLHEHALPGGLTLVEAELNSAQTLNSLSLEMVRKIGDALTAWEEREDIVAVLFSGSGDRAFCAGGDIQALYRAIARNHEAGRELDDYALRFFEEEYRLDYRIHTYPKPVITLGHGIVMGGGLGILSASRYRVLTDKSRLALPEITIGLFPDAGATWTLRNIAPHYASFLGLTGSQINANDGLLLGIGTHVLAHGERTAWRERLLDLPWRSASNDEMLAERLVEGGCDLPETQITSIPQREIDREDLAAEVAAIRALETISAWTKRGVDNLVAGCPTTAGIVLEQLRRAPDMDLAATYRMELTIATHCARNDDFAEGVRALLIDKDNAPQWRYGWDDLPREHVLSHFVEPWPEHPLRDLGV